MTHHFTLEVELLEPMALTDGSSDGAGGHESLTYIPGTSILGACVGALGIAPSDALFTALFLSDQTRFLNAYPLLDGARTLPRPLTLRIGKSKPTRVIDALEGTGNERGIESLRTHFNPLNLQPPADSMKSARESFACESDVSVTVTLTKQEQVHVGIDRATRAAQDGVLFTYESIPAGTRFRSIIATTNEEVAALLTRKTQFELRLGRSRSAGYGMAKATLAKATDGREYSARGSTVPVQATIITLIADYLPHLESAPVDSFMSELAAALGVDCKSITVRASATRMVRGFRGVWGLPRPARVALAKGSVVVISKTVDATRLTNLSEGGIGARRNEGFGRVAVNWTAHGAKSEGSNDLVKRAPTHKLARPKSPRPADTNLTAAISSRRSERHLRTFVDRALAHKKTQEVARALRKVPQSQLGNLRAAMASSMTPPEIAQWFRGMSEKTAGDRWKKATIPPLREKDYKRDGLGFVWSSLFGGSVDEHDKIGAGEVENWKSAVEMSLRPLVSENSLHDAASKNSDRTMRLYVIGLCGEVTRARTNDKDSNSMEGA